MSEKRKAGRPKGARTKKVQLQTAGGGTSQVAYAVLYKLERLAQARERVGHEIISLNHKAPLILRRLQTAFAKTLEQLARSLGISPIKIRRIAEGEIPGDEVFWSTLGSYTEEWVRLKIIREENSPEEVE